MPSIKTNRFRTELARSFHRDIVSTLNVPSGELNTLVSLDDTVYIYSGTEGETTFSGADDRGRTLSYTAGRLEVFVDGIKLTNDQYTATDGSSIELATAIGATQTDLTFSALSFAAGDVSTANDTITYTSHGLLTGDAVLYRENGGNSITGLSNNTRYFVIRVDDDTIKLATNYTNAIADSEITLSGSFTGTAYLLTSLKTNVFTKDDVNGVDGVTDADPGTHTIEIDNHDLETGDAVLYNENSGNAISGLVDGTTYYVIRTSETLIQLASSLSNALAGTALDLDVTSSTGTNYTLINLSDNTINESSNTLTIPNHDLNTGQAVTYTEVTGSVVGLTSGTDYYVIKVDDYNIKLAADAIAAAAGTAESISVPLTPGTFTLDGPLSQTVVVNTFTISNFSNPRDYFYVFLSRPLEWSAEPTAPTPVDSRVDESSVKRNIMAVKKINPNDVSLMARRVNWVTGTVYDVYDDDIDLSSSDFYVLNTDNYRVYKCLDNNNGAASTVKPSFSSVGPRTLSDGYKWQLIYEIPAADRLKFLDDNYIPVRFYGTSTRFDHNGTITNIVINSRGSGYTSGAPNVLILGDGSGATATATVSSNGILSSIELTNGGSGYSFAFVYIYGGGGSGATATAVLETTDLPNVINQNVASHAVAINGAIDKIEVTAAGSLYATETTTVSITGDGTGAAAEAIVSGGEITRIDIVDRGRDYTFAEVTITGDGSGATAKAIITPQGGHGSNIPQELFATTLGVAVNIEDFLDDFFLDNDFRQYGIIKNIRAFDNLETFSSATGNACYVITVPDGTEYTIDDNITSSSLGEYTVVYVNGNTVYLQPVINNSDVTFDTDTVLNNVTQGVSSLTVSSVTEPEISQRWGEVIYYNNISPLTRQEFQTEKIKLFINF